MKPNIWNRLSYIGLFLSLAVLLYVIYLLSWPFKTTVIYDDTEVLTPIVKAGETMQYTVHYCKYINKEAIVYRTIVDNFIVDLAAEQTNLPMGCNVKIISIDIPEFIPAGIYYINSRVVFEVNSLRDITIEYKSGTFQVI